MKVFLVSITLFFSSFLGAQPDSLSPHYELHEGYWGIEWLLQFHIDSLRDQSAIIPFDLAMTKDGQAFHGHLKNGAPVGYCTILFSDGKIMEEAAFDSSVFTFYFNNCGDCYSIDSFISTTPLWFKKYYVNGNMMEEKHFSKPPGGSGARWLETTSNTYFRNGHPYELQMTSDTLKYYAYYDFLLRMKTERRENKDSLIERSFDYEKGEEAIRRYTKKSKGKKISANSDFVIDFYSISDSKFIRRDTYKQGKKIN